jgi:hypothetical protein
MVEEKIEGNAYAKCELEVIEKHNCERYNKLLICWGGIRIVVLFKVGYIYIYSCS